MIAPLWKRGLAAAIDALPFAVLFLPFIRLGRGAGRLSRRPRVPMCRVRAAGAGNHGVLRDRPKYGTSAALITGDSGDATRLLLRAGHMGWRLRRRLASVSVRRFFVTAVTLVVTVVAVGCRDDETRPRPVTVLTEFHEGAGRWEAGFADFGDVHEPLDRGAGLSELPPSIPDRGPAFRVSGDNKSGDLFMFLTRPVTGDDGVVVGARYDVEIRVRFASDAPSDCVGIGGAPGESVYLKAGATGVRPRAVLERGEYRMNVEKGNQAGGGPAATVIGDVANGVPCEQALGEGPPPYRVVERSGALPRAVTAPSDATLWLLVGTDSGFEGTTTIYYTEIEARLVPVTW